MNELVERIRQYNLAQALATHVHREQMYGAFPYHQHLSDVVNILSDLGVSLKDDWSYPILVAAWLHDTLEDTHVTLDDLKNLFDDEIVSIIWNVTDEPNVSRRQKKLATYEKIKTDERSLVLKLADRLANVRFSSANNPKFFGMYQREHQEFSKHLKPLATHPIAIKLWQMLNDIIQPELKNS